MSKKTFEDDVMTMTNTENEEGISVLDDTEIDGQNGTTNEGTSDAISSLAELMRRISEMRSNQSLNDEEDEEKDFEDDDEIEDEDEDDESEDEDDDEDEDEDEDDEGEDEDEEDELTASPKSKNIPVGKRVVLRSDYKSNKAYCDAVVKSMKAVLRKMGIREEPHSLREDVKVFGFDHTTRGVDVDCHILCEYELCNYRIEFKFNVDNRPGRTPLIDYFCQDKNFPLRYGSVIMDHNDNEKKIEYSSCFYGAFSEETFARYWQALDYTLKAYAKDYESIASNKKLDAEQRKLNRKLLNDLASNLPARVKEKNEDVFNRAVEVLGGSLSTRMKKLLNYIVEHLG